MATDFYVNIKGKVAGPIGTKELVAMAESGDLSPNDMVRKGISSKWFFASQIKGLNFPPSQDYAPANTEGEEILEVSQESSEATKGLSIPAPFKYGFVGLLITLYYIAGCLMAIGTIFIVVFIIGMESRSQSDSTIKFITITGAIIIGALSCIFTFAVCQLLAMALDWSKNFHYIMHSNLTMMEIFLKSQKSPE